MGLMPTFQSWEKSLGPSQPKEMTSKRLMKYFVTLYVHNYEHNHCGQQQLINLKIYRNLLVLLLIQNPIFWGPSYSKVVVVET